MIWLYQTFLYDPLFNLLVFFYNIIPGHDIGIAIILLTIIIKFVLLPFSMQAIKAQKAMQELQPKMDAIRAEFKDQKDRQAQEIMKLYKEHKVNPLASCLPILIQFPFLIAVYQVFSKGLHGVGLDQLYSFIANPGTINTISLGFMDLLKASWPLAILAGIAQYIQTHMLQPAKTPASVAKTPGAKDENMMSEMNKSMNYFMPLITIVIGGTLPAGLTLYWFITTVLTVLQQKFFLKPTTPKNAGEIEVIPPQK